jgi:hypothetical protein
MPALGIPEITLTNSEIAELLALAGEEANYR